VQIVLLAVKLLNLLFKVGNLLFQKRKALAVLLRRGDLLGCFSAHLAGYHLLEGHKDALFHERQEGSPLFASDRAAVQQIVGPVFSWLSHHGPPAIAAVYQPGQGVRDAHVRLRLVSKPAP